jgi:hypothetical protein
MKETKSENCSFRLTPSMKLDLMKRSGELGKQPGEYIIELIEKDLQSKASEIPEREQTFIEKQFEQFTKKLLSFFVENYDKKLLKIEHLSAMSFLISNSILSQACQTAIREKELLYSLWKDAARVDALDGKIKDRINIIMNEINLKIDKGEF